LMKTTCLNRFSRYFHDNHWKHVRRHPMGTNCFYSNYVLAFLVEKTTFRCVFVNNSVFNLHFMKVSTEINNNFGYKKITQKTTCLNRFSRYFHDNHWKHARRHPMGTNYFIATTYFRSKIFAGLKNN
jgi:ureidoglycolate hydrolase